MTKKSILFVLLFHLLFSLSVFGEVKEISIRGSKVYQGQSEPLYDVEVHGNFHIGGNGKLYFPDGSSQNIATLQGPKGDTGPQGPPGPQGAPAPSALCTWSNKTYSTGAKCLSGNCQCSSSNQDSIYMVCQSNGTWLSTDGGRTCNCPNTCGY